MMERKNPLRFTPEQLEQLTTHEVADLLGNLVLLLRRLPDIPMVDLQSEDRSGVWAQHSRTRSNGKKRTRSELGNGQDQDGQLESLPDWTTEKRDQEDEDEATR